MLALSKENGLVWLEAYEKMLNSVLKLEEDTAKELKSDWVETLVSTQADLVRDHVAGVPRRREGSPEVVPLCSNGCPPGLG